MNLRNCGRRIKKHFASSKTPNHPHHPPNLVQAQRTQPPRTQKREKGVCSIAKVCICEHAECIWTKSAHFLHKTRTPPLNTPTTETNLASNAMTFRCSHHQLNITYNNRHNISAGSRKLCETCCIIYYTINSMAHTAATAHIHTHTR